MICLDTDTVNFVYTTDWHLSDKPPGRRQDDYRRAILKKIEFVRDLTERNKAVALCGADVFHIKNPSSPANSFSLLYELVHLLRRFPHKCVWGTVGNHDLSYDNMATLRSQPLGLLIASGVYKNLVDGAETFSNRDGSVKVFVQAFPYAGGEQALEFLRTSGPRPPDVTYRVALVHALGRPGGASDMFGDRRIGYDEVQDLDFDFFLWGHDHARRETETVGNITHVNLGSLARAAFASDEVERPVVATALSFGENGVNYKEVPIPVKPLELTFRLADKGVESVAKTDTVTEFLTGMDEAVDGIESTDPREVLAKLCPDNPELLRRVLDLCEL